ncbi:hypothetical protein RSAG8_04089, partial [Rhizoctonia solani AG-8 WAC10335]
MVSSNFDHALVEILFPAPGFAAFKGVSAPAPSPGITPESTATPRKSLMMENYKKFHARTP